MFPREVLQALVFALAALIVALAVVMAGFALLQGTAVEGAAAPGQADPLARVFHGVGIGLLVLLLIDALLLLVALGINELGRAERTDERRERRAERRERRDERRERRDES